MPGIPGGWELVLLLGVLVLLFGASKLPNAARSIGQSMRIFKAETKGMRSDEGQHKNEGSSADQPDGNQALPPSSSTSTSPPEPSRPVEAPQRSDTDTTR